MLSLICIISAAYTLHILYSTAFAQPSLPNTARALIFSATAEFRHDSIPTAIQAMNSSGSQYNIRFDNTEDQSWFKDGRINAYDVLIFLDNTGEVLDDSAQDAFVKYIASGGNFVGIHAASDCLRNSTFYGNELGSHFDYHPEITNAIVDVIDNSHPSTSMLPAQWHVFDEMYNFKSDPRSVGAVVILSANDSSYTDPGPRRFDQGTPHPTAWYQDHGAGANSSSSGRSWYTSLGHTNETWMDVLFISHVMGGISWVLQSNTTNFTNPTAAVGPATATSSETSAPSNTPSTGHRTSASRWLVVPIIIAIFITVG